MRIRSFRFQRVLRVVVAFLLFDNVALISRSEESLPEKSAVVSSLREYLSSIQTIQVRFKTSMGAINVSKTPGIESEVQSFEWVEQGRQKFLRMEGNASAFTPIQPLFIAHDGQVAYYVDYDPENPQRIRNVRRTPEINFGFHAIQTPALMCGMRVPGLDGTLCDLVATNSAKIMGTSEIFSARCLHISVPECVGLGGYRTAIDVWLDIERDFLPRRIVFKITDESPEIIPRARSLPARFEALELQSISDELLGGTRWFPRTITVSDFSGSRRMSVDSVTLNRHLPNSFFQPTMPNGTMIIEGEDRPFEKNRPITVVGGSSATAAMVDQRLLDAAKLKSPNIRTLNAPDGFVNANTRHGWNLSLCVSVVCILVLAGIGARNLWFRA